MYECLKNKLYLNRTSVLVCDGSVKAEEALRHRDVWVEQQRRNRTDQVPAGGSVPAGEEDGSQPESLPVAARAQEGIPGGADVQVTPAGSVLFGVETRST